MPLIRNLQTDDLDAVLAIESAAQLTPWQRTQFEESMAQDLCLVAVANEIVVGFTVCRSLLDEAELLTIAVAPSARRSGVATALLNRACEQLSGVTSLFLEVRASNIAAQTLYEQLGFSTCGRRKNYYRTASGREDAVLMQLTL